MNSMYDERASTRCTYCQQPYTEPRTLSCRHTFCTLCLMDIVNSGEDPRLVQCSRCGHQTAMGLSGILGLDSPHSATSQKKFYQPIVLPDVPRSIILTTPDSAFATKNSYSFFPSSSTTSNTNHDSSPYSHKESNPSPQPNPSTNPSSSTTSSTSSLYNDQSDHPLYAAYSDFKNVPTTSSYVPPLPTTPSPSSQNPPQKPLTQLPAMNARQPYPQTQPKPSGYNVAPQSQPKTTANAPTSKYSSYIPSSANSALNSTASTVASNMTAANASRAYNAAAPVISSVSNQFEGGSVGINKVDFRNQKVGVKLTAPRLKGTAPSESDMIFNVELTADDLKWTTQLLQLQEMGFNDTARNIKLLKENNGNLDSVISKLM
eukprot:TRINITY_DN12712_c0_g1_i1.p1 TRINITY_DN12712_c0_g1~~TRINITY_DN12712_c0_g1_i1.p1  ORF type:complete len:375 (-),score=53.92 TRINITY_DN12712_c0_g1_i1:83-1207(-)